MTIFCHGIIVLFTAVMETLGLLTTQTVNKIDPEKVEKVQTTVTNKTLNLHVVWSV